MKKIKCIFKLFLFAIFCNFMIINVNAAGANISVSSSAKQVIVGNTVKVTITISSSAPLGSWDFDLDYDSNVLSFVSSNLEGNTRAAGYASNGNTKSKSYTVTFKAKNSGSAKVGIKNVAVYGYDESSMSVNGGNVTIKTITQKELESTYSTDNTLKSLSIDGYDISPSFNKNTTQYSLTVPNDVKSIRVRAEANDSKARVSGAGTISLDEGNNKINVVVTAENGNKKTYSINVTVKELDPITVKIDGKEYTVIRKANLLSVPSTFVNTTTMIEGETIPALKSNITNYLLVGLSDSLGNVNLYIYSDGKYTLYNEYKFNGITLYTYKPEKDDMLKVVKETSIKYNDDELVAYSLEGLSYPLLYGVNVETGEANWYTYEETEKTVQKYASSDIKIVYSDEGKESKEKKVITTKLKGNNYKNLAFILGGIAGILFIFLIIAAVKISKQNKTEI